MMLLIFGSTFGNFGLLFISTSGHTGSFTSQPCRALLVIGFYIYLQLKRDCLSGDVLLHPIALSNLGHKL